MNWPRFDPTQSSVTHCEECRDRELYDWDFRDAQGGAVLVCQLHGLLAFGRIYDIDWGDVCVACDCTPSAPCDDGDCDGVQHGATDKHCTRCQNDLDELSDTVSDLAIENLRVDAGQHGDAEQALLCERALRGDTFARIECERVIRNARTELGVTDG